MSRLQEFPTNSNPTSTFLSNFKFKCLFGTATIISAIAYRRNGTVNRRLINLADIRTPSSSTPINGVYTFDHTIDISRQLWFRLFLPEHATQTNSSLPLIIYFHGGGFVHYSPSTKPFDILCRRLAGSTPAVVVSVNYRLAPEYKFPAQYDDGFDAVKFIDSELRGIVENFPVKVDLRQCFVAGDSAGGNLAHHVVVRCNGFEFKEVRIRGLIVLQPFFGGKDRTESEIRFKNGFMLALWKTDFYWEAFLPGGLDRDHPAVNVVGSGSMDISRINYPPTLVVVGGLDLLQDWVRRYADWLKRSGKEVELVEYPNVDHGFYCIPGLPEYDMVIAQVREFVRKQ